MTPGLLEVQNRNSVLFSTFLICFLKETHESPRQFSLIPPPALDPGHVLITFSNPKVISDAKIPKEALLRMEKHLPFFYFVLLMEMPLTTAMVFLSLLRSTDEASTI